ncbi:MAG TPA: ADOP family duplicated permease [Thermoanaerobaculia bacterium]|nr:ADOP family duplicated permease [Thermoanaerobaculia bacterium]
MTRHGRSASERWFRLLLRLYPVDFRDEMGEGFVETYLDRARAARERRGALGLLGVWGRALWDSLRNGPGERARPAVRWRRSGNWGRDMEMAARRLLRAPLFVLLVTGTLTVGLGAFAMVYAVVHHVLIAPLPYERPQDLYFVWRDYRAIFDLSRGWLGGTDIAELDRTGDARARVIEAAAGMRLVTATLTSPRQEAPQEIRQMIVSPGLFELLGVRAATGRTFGSEEVGEGRPAVAVLTHGLAKRLGGEATAVENQVLENQVPENQVLGTEIRLDGTPYTVIGVMGRDFGFVRHASLGPADGADVYTTFPFDLAETNPGTGAYSGLIRVRPGTSPERVVSLVDAVGRRIDERDFRGRGVRLYPVGLEEDLVAGVRPALVVLGLAGVFLVLVLAVNLATLLLARAAQREQEFAVARALGANGFALMRATLLEGGLLGLLGGAGGALAAVWGTRALVGLAPLDLPRRDAIAVDLPVAGVVVALGGVLGLLAAAAPALWSSRTRLSGLLRNAAVRGGGGPGRMRRGMVVVQVALSLVLLSTGGLVVRSFERLLRADPGFDPAHVLSLRVPVTEYRYPDVAAAAALHARIIDEVQRLPGVLAVSGASALPLSAGADQSTVSFPGAPGNTGEEERDHPLADYIGVRPGYFEVLGIALLEGRTFAEAAETPSETVIDEMLAAQFFPAGGAVGRELLLGDDPFTVIGVVAHARLYDVHADGRPQIFVRSDEAGYATLSFVVRSEQPPERIAASVQAAIRTIDPKLAIADVRSMDAVVAESLRQPRLSAVLIAGFALGALLLAAMGLFGIVSGAVTSRRHELAVRLALGADPGRVLRLVLREGVALVAVGLLIGVPGVLAAGRAARAILVDVSPTDPLTLGAVGLTLVLIATLACYIPARRAVRIDPPRSLRQE